jgi:phosphoglucosamine mutase
VVDCANGAAWSVAPRAYREAGAEVIALHALPDGENINDGCGSTHLDDLRAAVVAEGAHLGIAHDGDADRCLAVDADGAVVDGDQIMAVLALAMKDAGVALRTTAVGDRYVLEELRARGLALGGEQSGHVIIPGFATTGDGLLTAMRLMARVSATGTPLSALAGVMTKLPQVLINVRVADKAAVAVSPAVSEAVAEVEAELGDTGRVLLRPSGTEQLVRVMVEAGTEELAQAAADRLAGVVATA